MNNTIGFDWEPLTVYLGVALLAGLKFYVGLVAALIQGFSFWEIMLTACPGALCGVWIYTYFGDVIRMWFTRMWPWNRRMKSLDQRPRLVRLWKSYGLAGIAVLIPVLSPQVCIGIALFFQEKRHRILIYMGTSVVFWSALCAALQDTVLMLVGRQ